jgi:hypothetical protein
MRKVLSGALIASIGVLLLAGCGSYLEINGIAKKNRAAMPRITPGITPDAVVRIMEGEPYLTELFKGKEGEQILVYKYIIRAANNYNNLTDDDLTPFIFVNNFLDGWGWSYLETASKKYEFVVKVKNR